MHPQSRALAGIFTLFMKFDEAFTIFICYGKIHLNVLVYGLKNHIERRTNQSSVECEISCKCASGVDGSELSLICIQLLD